MVVASDNPCVTRSLCGRRPLPARHRRAAGEDGFAAIDALVGLMILATTLILAFQAMGTAGRLAAGAAETRRASALLDVLMQSSPGVAGSSSGRNAGFDWTLAVDPTGPAPGGLMFCRRTAQAFSRATRRPFRAATVEICREKAAA